MPVSAAARRRMRRVSWVAAGLSLLLAALAAAGYAYLRFRYDQIHKLSVKALTHGAGGDAPLVFLLVGNNSRAVLNGSQASQFGSAAQVGGARSDVTLLLRLDPRTRTASLLSIPRDLFVPIPGTNRANRIDDALNVGPQELVQTIQDDLGIPINHFVELNFDTFQNVVNALGGVNMDFPDPVYDSYSGLDITRTGCLHLNGTQALALVRARHMYYTVGGVRYYDGLGDLSRIHRDHEFLKVLAAQVKGEVANPLTANALIGDIAPQLQVDSGLSESLLLHLVERFRSINAAAIPSATLPVAYANNFVYRGADYGDVVLPVQPLDRQVIARFLQGRPASSPVAPPSIQVLVRSGTAHGAGTVAAGLRALGFDVVGLGSTTAASNPAETIVYYQPGHLGAGEQVAAQLGGEVILGQRQLPAGVTVSVVVGTNISVAAPASSGSSGPAASPTGSASPPSAGGAAAGGPSTAGVAPVEPASQPLPAYDPRACPPGASAQPAS